MTFVPVAPALTASYGKGTDSDATDAMVVADTLTSGSHPGSNMPGRRREDDTNIVLASTLKGQRGRGGGGIGPEETLVAGFSENQRGELLETSYAHQLTSGGGKPGQGYGAVRVDAAVRRLTPVECERLQGLPDDWTLVPDTAPDSRRYAGLGDAVTANVGEWIGRRLLAAESARPAA